MSYTDEIRYQDINKVLYSPYYGALADKQHGTGIMTKKDFLADKIALAEQMFAILGGKDPEFLKLLFTADALASAPFGFGGEKVLRENYQYDKNQITQKIAQKLQLSETLIKSLDRNSVNGDTSLEVILLHKLSDSVENLDSITPEIKEQFLACARSGKITKEFIQQLRNQTPPPEREEKVTAQEASMRYVLSKMTEQQKENPLKHLLRIKESDFAQLQQK